MLDVKVIEAEPMEKKIFHVKLYGGFFLKYHESWLGFGEDWRNMRRHVAEDLKAIKESPRTPEVPPLCDQILSVITRDTDKFYPPDIKQVRDGLLGIHRIYPEII